MKKSAYVILGLGIFASCSRMTGALSVERPGSLCIECAGYECDTGTKSFLYNEDDASLLEDVNIFVYDSTGILANDPSKGDYRTYFLENSGIDTGELFPDPFASYSVYVLGGCGYLHHEGMLEEDNAKNFSFAFTDYYQLCEYGVIKAEAIRNFCPTTSPLRIPVRRLMARYNVKIVNDSGYSLTLKSVRVRQSAKDIRPFVDESAAYETFSDADEGDRFSSSELEALEGTLYIPENVRGDVFEPYSGPATRTIDNLDDYEKTRCTYLEIIASIPVNVLHTYENATFRYFFGNEGYAGVSRNRCVNLTLKISQNCLNEDSWRKEPGEITISPIK